MEAAPPSYEKATLINHWAVIAEHIPSSDLCSASLVCSRWHATFVPHIWGNPASHFGIENDRVYVALTRFKRTLQSARLLVRSLTHTLHLPPAHAELYDGPHADWLREILERLPNLQSLIVRGLPFFDHAALQALKYVKAKDVTSRLPEGVVELAGTSGPTTLTPRSGITGFGLRLLDCSRCPNVTSHGLAQALGCFEALLYLDLSFTYPACDLAVLSVLRRFHGLQVLKLRGISLRDEGLCTLAEAVGLRVRSLDIRENNISDRGVHTLLNRCFALNRLGAVRAIPTSSGARSPTLLPYLGSEMLNIYQGEEFEGYLRTAFTDSFVSRLAIEDAPERGITHLYIAGNSLTAEGASGLVRSERLHVLDLASVSGGVPTPSPNQDPPDEHSSMSVQGVEKLTPILAKHAAETLKFLRIGHDVVTRDAPNFHFDEGALGRIELGDTAPPELTRYAAELDGAAEIFELSADHTPRAELVGDPMQILVSPATNDPPHVLKDFKDSADDFRRDSISAPELVPIELQEASTGRMNFLSPVSAFDEEITSTGASSPSPVAVAPVTTRPRSFSSVELERRARLNAHSLGSHNLHPAMLPHVRTLILTEVPLYSSGKEISNRLIRFITQCACESLSAKKQARFDYSVPPGRKGHAAALKHSADKTFALKRLVLELESEQTSRQNKRASPWQHTTTRSMTQDRDSEALWSAAETDFSFFGAGEECGLPNLEPGFSSHPFLSSEKEVSFGDTPNQLHQLAVGSASQFDNVALLSAFRKERKLAYQRNIAAGASDPETEGYWDGVVQVVRSAGGLRSDEDVDYYGNRFESGWLYK